MFARYVRMFLLVAILAAGPMAFAQSASELLEKGIYTEETAGDLDAAIGIYEQIVGNHDANHTYIARAQFRLGVCYEKKGMEQEAAAAFRQVVERYADQPALVARARVRLTNLGFGTNGETLAMSTRQVWDLALDTSGRPSPDGRYLSYVNWDSGGNLAVHDTETGENRDLTVEGNYGKYSDASLWSPDGSQIVYSWYNDPVSELRIVGLDGAEPRVLCEVENLPFLYEWTQDGKYILAVGFENRTTQFLLF